MWRSNYFSDEEDAIDFACSVGNATPTVTTPRCGLWQVRWFDSSLIGLAKEVTGFDM